MKQFIHDPLLTWRLTMDNPSPAGAGYRSERRESLIATDHRRPSIMDADIPPSVLMAQMQLTPPNPLPGGPPPGRMRARTNSTTQGANGMNDDAVETQNVRAMQVLSRVREKLTGRDFRPEEELPYIAQVDKLLIEATKLENLCQHYIGWCSFW